MAMSRKKKIIIGAIAAALLITVVVGGILATRKDVPEVTTVKITMRPELRSTVTSSGEVRPIQFMNLTSEVQGRIEEIYVKEGQKVEKGAPLVRLDPNQFESSTDAQLAAFQSAQNEVNVSQSQVTAAQNNLAQTQQQLAAAQVAVDTARQQVVAANENNETFGSTKNIRIFDPNKPPSSVQRPRSYIRSLGNPSRVANREAAYNAISIPPASQRPYAVIGKSPMRKSSGYIYQFCISDFWFWITSGEALFFDKNMSRIKSPAPVTIAISATLNVG
nr:biotin/lipoyl-binding protein [Leptolyngbya sp. 7M]